MTKDDALKLALMAYESAPSEDDLVPGGVDDFLTSLRESGWTLEPAETIERLTRQLGQATEHEIWLRTELDAAERKLAMAREALRMAKEWIAAEGDLTNPYNVKQRKIIRRIDDALESSPSPDEGNPADYT